MSEAAVNFIGRSDEDVKVINFLPGVSSTPCSSNASPTLIDKAGISRLGHEY